MNIRFYFAAGLLALIFSAIPLKAIDVDIGVEIHSRSDFEAPLAASGVWVEVGSHGRCWRPRSVGRDWRPYCEGRWIWSDCGWYWESDEPWAWATYHYGTWVLDPGYGWVWIPDVEWAPAWVEWRTGGSHIGWAPAPPAGVVLVPTVFVFVESRRFPEYHRRTSLIVENDRIFRDTREVRNIRRENRNIGGRERRVVVNEGPGVAEIEKATGRKMTAVAVTEADRKTREQAPPELRKKRDTQAPAAPEAEKAKGEGKQNKDQVGTDGAAGKAAETGQKASPSQPDAETGKRQKAEPSGGNQPVEAERQRPSEGKSEKEDSRREEKSQESPGPDPSSGEKRDGEGSEKAKQREEQESPHQERQESETRPAPEHSEERPNKNKNK